MRIEDIATLTYHTDIGIPTGLARPVVGMPLLYSAHARRAIADDRLTSIPSSLPNGFRVIEVTALGTRAIKWLVRFRWTNNTDLVLVLKPRDHGYRVETAWVNQSTDNHSTLNRARYAR